MSGRRHRQADRIVAGIIVRRRQDDDGIDSAVLIGRQHRDADVGRLAEEDGGVADGNRRRIVELHDHVGRIGIAVAARIDHRENDIIRSRARRREAHRTLGQSKPAGLDDDADDVVVRVGVFVRDANLFRITLINRRVGDRHLRRRIDRYRDAEDVLGDLTAVIGDADGETVFTRRIGHETVPAVR